MGKEKHPGLPSPVENGEHELKALTISGEGFVVS
jgi:hypothetical protein